MPFAYNITSYWSCIFSSCTTKELWKLLKTFTSEGKLLMNQLLMKKCYDSRVESVHLIPTPMNDSQACLTHLSVLCPALTTQRYLDSFGPMVLKIQCLETTCWFFVTAMLCWWNLHMMHCMGNITRISQI